MRIALPISGAKTTATSHETIREIATTAKIENVYSPAELRANPMGTKLAIVTNVPISIGVLLVSLMSLYETVTHGAHAYFDGAVMLLFFLLCGRWLDSVMRDRARGGVTALLGNMGTGAMVFRHERSTHWVDATALEPGMVMLVAAGERLAADGVVAGHRPDYAPLASERCGGASAHRARRTRRPRSTQ